MKKLIIPVISMMLLTSCANGQANTAAGAAIGAVAGAAVGANNKAPVAGALTGAIVGGLIGNAVDQNQAASQPPPPPPVVRQPPVPQVVVREVPTVVVETPVIIEEHIWAGSDLWIYSYRGYRDNFGRVHYRNHIPTQRRFIRGGIGYRR